MVNIVSQDDGTRGTADANNREFGGSVSIAGVVTEAPPGAVSNPKDNARASIEIPINNDTKSTFHSHPSAQIVEGKASGSNTIQTGGTIKTYNYTQAPSSGAGLDVHPGNDARTNYVFGRRDGTVYIYNSQTGVQATIPMKRFVNPKQ